LVSKKVHFVECIGMDMIHQALCLYCKIWKIDVSSTGHKMVAYTCMNNYETWVEILQWKLQWIDLFGDQMYISKKIKFEQHVLMQSYGIYFLSRFQMNHNFWFYLRKCFFFHKIHALEWNFIFNWCWKLFVIFLMW
jgi:hypothetical protein